MNGLNKRPLVLLSGGLDSTYLAYSLLQETDIDVMYVSGIQQPDKVKAEQAALENIYKWLEKNCKFKIYNKLEYNIECGGVNASNTKFGQISTWFYAALNMCGKYHSYVAMSFVAGDQIIYDLKEIEKAWNSLAPICQKEPASLSFPLVHYNKQYILSKMPKELVKLTWTCEFPIVKDKEYTECKLCTACVRKQMELSFFKRQNRLLKIKDKKENERK